MGSDSVDLNDSLRVLVLTQANLFCLNSLVVIPVQAGIQGSDHHCYVWIPACAGMTVASSIKYEPRPLKAPQGKRLRLVQFPSRNS